MNVFFEVGIVFQFGVFYITLLDIFQSGRAKTVAVQSLLGGFTLSLDNNWFICLSKLIFKLIEVSYLILINFSMVILLVPYRFNRMGL
jgi:hypothetical protein